MVWGLVNDKDPDLILPLLPEEARSSPLLDKRAEQLDIEAFQELTRLVNPLG